MFINFQRGKVRIFDKDRFCIQIFGKLNVCFSVADNKGIRQIVIAIQILF